MKRLYSIVLVMMIAVSNLWAEEYLPVEIVTGSNGDKQEILLARTAQRRTTRKKRKGNQRNIATTKATTASSNDAASGAANAPETSAQVVINHVVKKGDSFESIAKEYNIAVEQLKSDNPGVKKCKEGATLVVRKDVSVKDATKIKAQNKEEKNDKKKDKKEKKSKDRKEEKKKDPYKVDKKSSTDELFEQIYLLESEIDQHEASRNALPDDKEHKKERKKEEKEIDKLHKTVVKCYDAIIKKEPSMEAYLGRGTHQMELNKHKQAISDFEKVLSYDNVNKNTREFCQICIKSERAKHQENAERRKAILTAIGVGVIGAATVAATTAAIVDASKHGGSTTTTVITTTPAPATAYSPTPMPITGRGSARASKKAKEDKSTTSSNKKKYQRDLGSSRSLDRAYFSYFDMILNILVKHHLKENSLPEEFKVLSKREIEDIKEYQQNMKEIRIFHNGGGIHHNFQNIFQITYNPIEDLKVDYYYDEK